MLWVILLDHMIVKEYAASGQQISVLWQMLAYIFIGAGEIFCMASAYKATFLIGPKNTR